jgi:hypothetical protein
MGMGNTPVGACGDRKHARAPVLLHAEHAGAPRFPPIRGAEPGQSGCRSLSGLRSRPERDRLHRELLPLDELATGAAGVMARLVPGYCRVGTGAVVRLRVHVHDPLPAEQEACAGQPFCFWWAYRKAAATGVGHLRLSGGHVLGAVFFEAADAWFPGRGRG